MNVGILGLGLIGGSLAKAYKEAGHTVYAFDTDETILSYAKLTGTVDGNLDAHTVNLCELLLLAVSVSAACAYLEKNAALFKKELYVVDCCGTKKDICAVGHTWADKYGFTFIGGHPMAGTHHAGFKYSRSDMFRGAVMVLVPARYDDISMLARARELLMPPGFGKFTVTTAKEHDKIIAFTSQLAHIVSNAYIKSPTAANHAGISAGSYRDLTRVAYLNPTMWANLCMQNKENVLFELDAIIASLTAYREAMTEDDMPRFEELLREGAERKEAIDGDGNGTC